MYKLLKYWLQKNTATYYFKKCFMAQVIVVSVVSIVEYHFQKFKVTFRNK